MKNFITMPLSMIKKFFSIIAVISVLFFCRCIEKKDGWHNAPVTDKIGTILKTKNSLSTFYTYAFDSIKKIVDIDSLIRTTNISKDGYTGHGFILFPPTNSAFNRFAQEMGVTELSQIKQSILKEIIKYHIVKGNVQRQYLKYVPFFYPRICNIL